VQDKLTGLHAWYAAAANMKKFEPVVKMIRKHEHSFSTFFSKAQATYDHVVF
jgi:hypothetical protein